MKKLISTIALSAVISSSAFAVSFVDTIVSPFYTVAGSIEATTVLPSASSIASSEAMHANKEKALFLLGEINDYDLTGSISTALEGELTAMKANPNFASQSDDELVSIIEEVAVVALQI